MIFRVDDPSIILEFISPLQTCLPRFPRGIGSSHYIFDQKTKTFCILKSRQHPKYNSIHQHSPNPFPTTNTPNMSGQQPHHRGGGRGEHRGGRGGRGNSEGGGRGGRGGAHSGGDREKPKKENILDLGKYMDKEITVKFTGGREGEFSSLFLLA